MNGKKVLIVRRLEELKIHRKRLLEKLAKLDNNIQDLQELVK